MNTEQLNSLLGQSNGTPLVDFNKIMSDMMPFIVILTILSIVLTVLWIVHILQRMRVNKAILETRDILREMNERQKSDTEPPKPASAPPAAAEQTVTE